MSESFFVNIKEASLVGQLFVLTQSRGSVHGWGHMEHIIGSGYLNQRNMKNKAVFFVNPSHLVKVKMSWVMLKLFNSHESAHYKCVFKNPSNTALKSK